MVVYAVLFSVSGCGSARQLEAGHTTEAGDTNSTSSIAASSTILGIPFGTTRARVDSAIPGLVDAPTTDDGETRARGLLEVAGVVLELDLTFFDGALARASGYALVTDLARYDAVVAQITEALGPGARVQCGDDGDVPLARYLAGGHGSVDTEWETDSLAADVNLRPVARGTLSVHVILAFLPLAHRRSSTAGYIEGVANEPSGRALKQTSACPEVNQAPAVTFLGAQFGASETDVLTILGVARAESVRVAIGGVEGQLTTRFYDGCFANATFLARADIRGYRAITAKLLQELGTPHRDERCSADGTPPTMADIEAGRGMYRTFVREPSVQAMVSLMRGNEPLAIDGPVIELQIETPLLRGRAPRIDFASP